MGSSVLDTSVAFLKGAGPRKAVVFKEELGIATYADLITHFPFRYEDRTKLTPLSELAQKTHNVQFLGVVLSAETAGTNKSRQRFVAHIQDKSGSATLVWFGKTDWLVGRLVPGKVYLFFGKPTLFQGTVQVSHPEFELFSEGTPVNRGLEPVYPSTEKSRKSGLGPMQIGKFVRQVWEQFPVKIAENLPQDLLQRLDLPDRNTALRQVHFPPDEPSMQKARLRLKFEELFMAQMRLLRKRDLRKAQQKGFPFEKVGEAFLDFYKHHLPFRLTGAQEQVIKEIRHDLGSGSQMNRLLQGDVGSGKTVVAVFSMLLALDNGFQSVLLAPTEILAQQHAQSIQELLNPMGLKVGLLTGSTKIAARKELHQALRNGSMPILVGTHAVLEDVVQFHRLGLAVIDEQHRFGVAQRARLWNKSSPLPPHVLVMTATPIPRTLAMTRYGDLDVSIINELPPGRKPVRTVHRHEAYRLEAYNFLKGQIQDGRQAYMVYPLIEGSETLDFRDLLEGFERLKKAMPDVPADLLHGQMKPAEKEDVMRRFVKGEVKVLVATTVIEVGVNVPNATLMVIESAERFGLSQLHQLRGRVGRGADQSWCILLTGPKLSEEGKARMRIMCETNDGFKIAEKDLELRGPGEIEGTRQSGDLKFKIADLAEDRFIMHHARAEAEALLGQDPELSLEKHQGLKRYLQVREESRNDWSMIS